MKRGAERWMVCLLAAAALLLQGCAGGRTPAEQSRRSGTPAASGEARTDGERTMGRYLETEIALPEEVRGLNSPRLYFQKLQTGALVLIEQRAGMYVSEDNGGSWKAKDAPWLSGMRDAYIHHLAVAPNGAAAVVYSPPEKETSEEASGEASEEISEDRFRPVNLYVAPDGTETTLEAPGGDKAVHRFWFGRDSRLYGYDMGGRVYEMSLTGRGARRLFETEGLSDYICFTGRYMIDVTSRGILFYDMENEVLADADKVLQDFVAEQVGGDIGVNASSHELLMAQGEEADVVYLACAGGLYRHVIGGTAVEQIVDGSLSSLGDPGMSLVGMAVLPDNEFAVLYRNGTLCRYVYDPDIPSAPDRQISIYSLYENQAVRRAVSLFQKRRPEVYVRYEIGLEAESGMTAEDVVRNLNTRMMSGSGPELLVLDGLPRRSYAEKGVLMDLGELVSGMSGEDAVFPNIVEACREDGKLWYLPIRFRLPLLVGARETIGKAADLTRLADMVEALRETKPDGALTGLSAEEKALRTLGLNCSGAWTDSKTGSVDEEKLRDFLRQAKRIYQAEVSGLTEEELAACKEQYESSKNLREGMDYFAAVSSAGLGMALGEQALGLGVSSMLEGDFNLISTLAGQEEDFGYAVWQGQIRDGFIPKGMVGVSAVSGAEPGERELALDFFRFLYGRDLQDIETGTGYPVNVASFEHLKENPREEDQGLSVAMVDSDGAYFSLDIRWTGEEDFNRLKQMAESASAVCTGDAVIEETVYEVGQKALNGSVSVEEAVAEIRKKAELRLAE